MSSFVVLIFDSDQAKEKAREVASSFKIILYDTGYGVNPSIKRPHLFFEDLVMASIVGSTSHFQRRSGIAFDKYSFCTEADYMNYIIKHKTIDAEINQANCKQRKYFLQLLADRLKNRKRDFELLEYLLKQNSEGYPNLKSFINKIVEFNGAVEVLWHHSNHSDNECIPVNEEREVKFDDITVDTFALLPSNVLLRIIK